MRTRNEDCLYVLPELGVALVADGMGGHPSGNVASRIAAEAAASVLRDELSGGEGHPDPLTRMGVAMRRSVAQAHRAIRAEGEREPDLEGMGTTLTAMAVDPETDAYVLGHVGDSRAYRFRAGSLTQLTRDDTWVQERIEANLLTPEQARRHPFGHLLTQCLGLDDTPTPSILQGEVAVGDAYLLCTDGLVGMLEDVQVEQILARELSAGAPAERLEPALQSLLDAANDAGGHDNITAVLVSIGAR